MISKDIKKYENKTWEWSKNGLFQTKLINKCEAQHIIKSPESLHESIENKNNFNKRRNQQQPQQIQIVIQQQISNQRAIPRNYKQFGQQSFL